MKRILAVCLFALLLSVCATAATPQQYYLQGFGGWYGKVPAYPYYLWTQSRGQFEAMSDNWHGANDPLPSWSATDYDLTDGNNIGSTTFQNIVWYEQAGYIFQKYVASDPVNANVAIWAIMSQLIWGPPLTPQARAMIADAQANATIANLNKLHAIVPVTVGGNQEALYFAK
jgi:hypothetical protein